MSRIQARFESLARGRAVFGLRPVLVRVNDDHAIARHPLAGQARGTRLHVVRQRGRAKIEPQLRRRLDFVDVLSA